MEMWHCSGHGGVGWGWIWGSQRSFPPGMTPWFYDWLYDLSPMLPSLPRTWQLSTLLQTQLFRVSRQLFLHQQAISGNGFKWKSVFY